MLLLIIDDTSKGEDWYIQNQIGGGHACLPSPPPIETPTQLRSHIKPTVCDTGLVQQVEHRCALQVENALAPVFANSLPVTLAIDSVDNSNIDPALLSESSVPLVQLPVD